MSTTGKKKKLYLFLAALFLLSAAGCQGRAPIQEESLEETGNELQNEADAEASDQIEDSEASKIDDTEKKDIIPETAETKQAEKATLDLTVWLDDDFVTLDPVLARYDMEKTMLAHQYETLLIHDKNNRLIPGQAQSYEVSEDGLTYTFHLRDGLKWSDGSLLTASDFVYAWKRLADYSTASPYAQDLLGPVKGYPQAAENGGNGLGVSAPDDKTFVVNLSKPWVNFPQSCAHPALSPVKKDSVEQGGDDWFLSEMALAGNGPMKLDLWEENTLIRLVKNEHYWNQQAVSLKSITFLLGGEENDWNQLFQDGNIQIMAGNVQELEALLEEQASTEESDLGKQNEGLENHEETEFILCQAPVSGTYYILFDFRIEPFQDARVRRAMSMVLNRDYIAETIMEGNVLPAYRLIGPGISGEGTRSFWQKAESLYGTAGLPTFEDTSKKQEVLEEASELLAQAGYPGGEGLPVIELLTNDSGYHVKLGEYLQKAWAEIGIPMKVRIITWQYFTPSRHSGDFMIARGSWVMDTDDPLSFFIQFQSSYDRNDGLYANSAVDEALKAAEEAKNRTNYYTALYRTEQLLLEDTAAIPIAYYQDTWLQWTELEGITHMPDGTWRFMYGKQIGNSAQ